MHIRRLSLALRGQCTAVRGASGDGRLERGGGHAAPGEDDVVDEPVGAGFLGRQVVVPVDVECHLFDWAATVVGDDLGHAVGQGQDFPDLDLPAQGCDPPDAGTADRVPSRPLTGCVRSRPLTGCV